ncbi:MAG: serine/threonine-protein kinase [Polyangiaceae bacterium]
MALPEPGRVFANDFRIVKPLSSGGMGGVYVVEQLSTGKLRALKVVHQHILDSPDMRARFTQEARVGAKIDSEHVVEVIGAGVDGATQQPWLAMELLEGEDLSRRLGREPLPSTSFIVQVLSQLGHALVAAHAAGVVHRDLKPENIFLANSRRVGQHSVLKVLDFGIAKVLSDATGTSTATIGSPGWMAPEQVQRAMAISRATDVWAVSLIAFRMLSGVSYWRACAQPGGTPVMVLSEMLLEPMDPASARSAELGGRPLPPGFDEWFRSCTERDPNLRQHNIGEAMERLITLIQSSSTPIFDSSRGPSVAPDLRMVPARTVPSQPLAELAMSRSGLAPPAVRAARPAASYKLYGGLGVAGLTLSAVLFYIYGGVGSHAASHDPPGSRQELSGATAPGRSEVTASTSAVEPPLSGASTRALQGEAGSVSAASSLSSSSSSASARPSVFANPPPAATSARTQVTAGGVPVQTSKSDCRVPYTIDARGIKRVKPECM